MSSQDIQWLLAEKYRGIKSEAFYADCKRLALGEPLGYLIGHVPFLNTTIYLDSRPLVPRPETEFWTEKAIDKIKRLTLKNPKVLDLCSGSGCIGVAVAKDIPDSEITFVEVDKKHISTIRKNLVENEILDTRAIVMHSGLFQDITAKYDFILTNPPYIDSNLNRTDESVLDFEPHLALFGGSEGMVLIKEIIITAPHHLNPQGQLWLEHEPEQTAAIEKLAKESDFTVTTHKDQYGVERYSILVYDLSVKES